MLQGIILDSQIDRLLLFRNYGSYSSKPGLHHQSDQCRILIMFLDFGSTQKIMFKILFKFGLDKKNIKLESDPICSC